MPVNKQEILKAIGEAKRNSKKRRFIQSVELIMSFADLDLKKPDNRLNELIDLPHPPKDRMRIVVFAGGDLALRARNAGADQVFGRESLEAFASDRKGAKKLVNTTDFFIAETPLMPIVGKVLGPILGPKGKMPTPIPPTAQIDSVIDRHRRSVRLRVRDQPNAQCVVGTENMSDEELADNIQAIVTRMESRLPKGLNNIRELGVKTTMGPFVKIQL
ncbi:MAG: 50S ribosomal protein L1 [Candidatus Bathyarchaeia archaeon]